jgi:hypothetical protein
LKLTVGAAVRRSAERASGLGLVKISSFGVFDLMLLRAKEEADAVRKESELLTKQVELQTCAGTRAG